jgi:hypothetical protein
MKNIVTLHKTIANTVRMHWASHYSRVSGKPAASGCSFAFFDSIGQLPSEIWDKMNDKDDIFLSSIYLEALEQAPPTNMSFKYAIISKENVPVGIAYFQILELNHRLHKSPLELLAPKNKSPLRDFHDTLADTATVRLLICGNALLSGEHGFSMPRFSKESALPVIAEIAYTIRKSFTPRISVTLIKDLYKQQGEHPNALSRFGYYSFDAGPNMVIPLRKNWTTFDDYLKEMKPKYRKRATSAIKKGSTIRRKSLGLDEIMERRDELYALYCQVVNNAKFKIFFLSPDYYIELKKRLGEKFVCDGYLLNETLIGFTTRIFNGAVMEGYSHGFRYERNKEFELYQNFMLDDVKTAISARSSCVIMGRTSIAMKSSIGAIPNDMVCHLRFSGKLSNHLARPLFFFIKPANEYCRNPFQDSKDIK